MDLEMKLEHEVGFRWLILFALPTIFSSIFENIYSTIDGIFIARFVDTDALSAINIVMPMIGLSLALGMMFGTGGNALVAKKIGMGRLEEAREDFSLLIAVAFGFCIVLAAMCFVFLDPLCRFLGSDEALLHYCREYMIPVLIMLPFAAFGMVFHLSFITVGKAGLGAFLAVLGGVLNIVLDPFFILPQYMNMGAAGAGLATAISNTAGTLFFLLCLLRRSSTVLSLRPCHLKRTGVYIREILSIGFPSALQYALTVVSLAVLSLFVSKYAVEAVAAYGIVKKLDNLPLYFSLGTSAGLLPFLSYNYASGDRERQRQGFVFGVSITVGFSLACVIVFELFAPQLARLFIQDDMTVAYAAAFLRRMVLCMPFVAICHPMITQFQAMGRTRESLICSILRKGSLDIPLLLLLDRLYPLYGCALVQPVVDLISLIVALVLYRRLRRTSVV